MTSMPVFQPSKVSLTPRRKALLALSYAKAAIEKLEAFLSGVDDTEIPAWVFTRINQAATCFGQAVSFVKFTEEKTSGKKKQKEKTP
jgi:hypothetical protein